jgi:TRAP-type C4-dicarboxylate transport system permease small subunit
MTYAAAKFVHDEAQIGSLTFLNLPVWIPELVIPFTFALMALRFLLRFFQALRRPVDLSAASDSVSCCP